MADATFEEFFNSGGGASNSVAPMFRRKRATLNRSGGYFPDGFTGDGDYLRLPSDASSPLQYYNASGSVVWSRTPSDIFTGSSLWVTFALGAGGLLHCVTSTAGGAFRLSTVNSAGAVVEVGGFTPSPALTSGDTWTPFSTSSAAGAQLTAGNLAVYLAGRVITVNTSTGVQVSDVSSMCVKGSIKLGAFLVAITSALGTFSGINAYVRLRRDSGSLGAVADTTIGGDSGAVTVGAQPGVTSPFLSWGSEVIRVSACAASPASALAQGDYCVVFDPATLAADVATLAANLRFNI